MNKTSFLSYSKISKFLFVGLMVTALYLPTHASASLVNTYQAFVWAGRTTGSYTPHPNYSYNNQGGSLLVTWLATGQARVDLGNFAGADGGNVQVTSYGADNGERCKVETWVLEDTTMKIWVRCHAANGQLSSTPFVVVWGGQYDANGAWLWANNASASHTPNSMYSFNSKGGTNYVTRNSVGNYTVTTNKLTMWGGNAQVTAYGIGSEYCKIANWSNSTANVLCFNNAGNSADSRFSFRRISTRGYDGFKSFFVWAHDSTSSSYTPDPIYQNYESCTSPLNVPNCVAGDDNTAGRTSLGSYWVRYPDAGNSPTMAIVTAYGSDPKYCNIDNWSIVAGVRVAVRCWNPGGGAADARFSQLLLSDQ